MLRFKKDLQDFQEWREQEILNSPEIRDGIINGIEFRRKAHFWNLYYNGQQIGQLFTTYHPTLPYEVYYREGSEWKVTYINSSYCKTKEEAAAWVLSEMLDRLQKSPILVTTTIITFFGPWREHE